MKANLVAMRKSGNWRHRRNFVVCQLLEENPTLRPYEALRLATKIMKRRPKRNNTRTLRKA